MIILRYLSRELLQTTASVTLVLLVIIMSGRFVKYLAAASVGRLDIDVVLAVMAYRIPGFLELILPLSFFISLLLAYGRLYADSEMTVLYACGVSRRRILIYTSVPAGLLVIIVAMLSLWLSPLGLQKADMLLESQKSRSEFEAMQPGRFQIMGQGNAVSYAESLVNDRILQQLFIAQIAPEEDRPVIVRSATAQRVDNGEYNRPYWVFENGTYYQGRPGSADYRVTQFSSYGQYIPEPDISILDNNDTEIAPTIELLQSSNPEHIAAWQWRFSLPLLMLVIMLLGIPLSETNLRRGRYTKLFPSIILYLIYLVLLNASKGALEEGKLPVNLGLWWVHAVFIVLALILWIDKRSWIKKLSFD